MAKWASSAVGSRKQAGRKLCGLRSWGRAASAGISAPSWSRAARTWPSSRAGSHLAAMREHGLIVESAHDPIHLPKVNVTDDPATIGPVDMVMFCVKLWDTEDAARQLLPIVGPETGIISFQNGVQKDDMLRPIFGDKALMGGVAYVGTDDRPAGRDRCRPDRCSAWCSENMTAAARRAPRRSSPPASRAASMPSSATTSGARSGRNSWCWSRCPARPRRCASTIGPIRTQSADARIPARPGARGGRGRPRARRQPAGGLCRAAHPVLRRLAAGDDGVDASRPERRQAAGAALAFGRRGRSRRAGRRADADEPRGARHPHAARRRPTPHPRIDGSENGRAAAPDRPRDPRRRRRGADDLCARHQPRASSPRRRCC